LTPSVTVLISKFCSMVILTVSKTSSTDILIAGPFI
jgi:hypothetical protein